MGFGEGSKQLPGTWYLLRAGTRKSVQGVGEEEHTYPYGGSYSTMGVTFFAHFFPRLAGRLLNPCEELNYTVCVWHRMYTI